MKRLISFLLVMAMFCVLVPGWAEEGPAESAETPAENAEEAAENTEEAAETAEEPVEYSTNAYRFTYPAGWTEHVERDGTVILELPDTQSSIMCYAMITNMVQFTGDETADAQLAEKYISGYTREIADESGQATVLNGEYELIQHGEQFGFRAKGTWMPSGEDLVMIMLSGADHLVGLQFNGPEALALEKDLLDSLELLGDMQTARSGGYLHWESDHFTVNYPQYYAPTETNTGVTFVNLGDQANVIEIDAISVNFDYKDTEDMLRDLAKSMRPQAAGSSVTTEIKKIGDIRMAVMKGKVDKTQFIYYIFGKNRRVFVVLITGAEAMGLGRKVVESIRLK